MRSGLIPSLQGGYLVGASSSWRMAVFRPGDDPIGNLAAALGGPDVLGLPGEEFAQTNRVLVEATLRRGPLGLADAVRQARLPKDHNLLVLVDQFEELFRFRRNAHIANSRDEAIRFVRMLLEASRQQDLPIYIALTMRSDFIGDCMDFPGLSHAVNAGLYLVGRMSRDAVRAAIVGPVAVAGGAIAPRLVHRVLNDLGDDQDQLPRVQHALMRTWNHWAANAAGGRPIDIEDYEAIGAFDGALATHAEEAFDEAAADGNARLVERIFKALTDTVSDARGVRRPTSIGELAVICGVGEAAVTRIVEIFRKPGRTFLMPPASVPLSPTSIVDLSHESLMRCWWRLIAWAEEERAAAEFYIRVTRAAAWFDEGSGGLWRNPELELAQQWRQSNQPTAAWARRYNDAFETAMAFLDRSREARAQYEASVERERRARLRRVQWTAAVLALFLAVAVSAAYLALRESARASANLDLARAAVDESLSSVERDPARTGADLPQVEELRRDLLAKAGTFYTQFMRQEPLREPLRRDVAFAHFRLGHIDRMLEKRSEAEREYGEAIARFEKLAAEFPGRAEYRAALGNSYNWLGETLRPLPARAADAGRAYDRAYDIQRALAEADPSNVQVRRELARTHYNRGILRWQQNEAPRKIEDDFREAIRLLEPLSAAGGRGIQELARAYNNLGTLLSADAGRAADVRALWEKAIAIDERLVRAEPDNREYKLELATFCANLAALLHDEGATADAEARSRQAVALVEELSRTAPSLAVARADAHGLHGLILQTADPLAAEREYQAAVEVFTEAIGDPALRALPDFHLRSGDLLINLAAFARSGPGAERAGALLTRAASTYAKVAEAIAATGSSAEAQESLAAIRRVLPAIPERSRAELTAASRQLASKIGVSR